MQPLNHCLIEEKDSVFCNIDLTISDGNQSDLRSMKERIHVKTGRSLSTNTAPRFDFASTETVLRIKSVFQRQFAAAYAGGPPEEAQSTAEQPRYVHGLHSYFRGTMK